jgi:DNA-binding CsgD family transcriptional regulator
MGISEPICKKNSWLSGPVDVSIKPSLHLLMDFYAKVHDSKTLDALHTDFLSVISPYGFTHANCFQVLPAGKPRFRRLFGATFPDWEKRYAERNYIAIDPALRRLLAVTRDFAWSDISYATDDRGVRDMFGEARDMRHGDALVVPIHGPSGTVRVVIVSGDTIDLSPEARPAVRLAALYFAEVGCELMDIETTQTSAEGLTDRQIECLKWVSKGKSDWEIGEILGISENTAHRHIEAAKHRLDVSTRMQAVLSAIRLGYFMT